MWRPPGEQAASWRYQATRLLALTAIRFYRRWLSRYTPHCGQTPICSTYGLQAVQQYGARVGLQMTVERVVNCRSESEREMPKFPDFGFTESDPKPSEPVDFRPPPPSQAAQDHSSQDSAGE